MCDPLLDSLGALGVGISPPVRGSIVTRRVPSSTLPDVFGMIDDASTVAFVEFPFVKWPESSWW